MELSRDAARDARPIHRGLEAMQPVRLRDRWSGLPVVIHIRRQPEPGIHRFLPDRIGGLAERPMCQTRPQLPRRPQGCGLPPNRACCRNSGRNEIESDSRCRHRARKPSAHRRAAPALSDNWHRNGKRCQCGAGTPCSGTDRPDRVHPWQLLEASRSGIVRSVPSTPPNLVWLHFDRSGGLPSSRFRAEGPCLSSGSGKHD